MALKPLVELLGGVTRFERWTVLAEGTPKPYGTRRHRTALVRCDCGNTKTVAVPELKRGKSRSCGCLKLDTVADQGRRSRTHGESVFASNTAEYRIWTAMKARCNNPNHVGWPNYGGRGIAVCEAWASAFATFLADMGRRPSVGHSIDRVDNDGPYSPMNCRWATRAEQANNRR